MFGVDGATRQLLVPALVVVVVYIKGTLSVKLENKNNSARFYFLISIVNVGINSKILGTTHDQLPNTMCV